MRSLSATLLAAQRSSSSRPYVKVEVLDRLASVARPIVTRLYTGGEPDSHHAAAMPGDGSLVRARVDPSTLELYVQRIVNPGPGSNYSSWILLNQASINCNIVLCSRGAMVLLFYVDSSDNRRILLRESSNYGATWGSEQIVINPAVNAVKWLAADIATSGTVALFYGADDHTVWVLKRPSGGNWGNPASWSNSVSNLTGMAAVYQGDWNLVLTGQDSSNDYKVWTCIFGDGASQAAGTWSSLMELTSASSGSSVEFRVPFVSKPDVYRMFFVEKYTGVSPYTRCVWSHSLGSATFAQNLWREPVPFNLSTSYGLALAYSAGYLWLSTPSGVWRGSISSTPLDLSNDLLSLTLQDDGYGGSVSITLRNDDGRYGSVGSGTYASLRKGSEVRISPGYRTSAGNEVSTGPTYWVHGWEYVSKGGQALFVLQARSAWAILDNWRARRQYVWALGQSSVLDIVTFILARAGLEVGTLSSSQTITTHKPSFTIQPGERGTSAAKRLMSMVPDVLLVEGAKAYVKNAQSTDVSDYAYGTNHPLLEGRYISPSQEVNRAQVYGSGVMGESFSWAEVEEVHDRLVQIHDLNVDTASKAQDRGDAALRKELLAANRGEIVVPTNCGQQLFDVVEVTDSRAGLNAAKYRVSSILLECQMGARSSYRQRIGLTGV